jgi:hypothetical protein
MASSALERFKQCTGYGRAFFRRAASSPATTCRVDVDILHGRFRAIARADWACLPCPTHAHGQ